MDVKASTILSFYTGRLYSTTPPTMLFGPMLEFVLDREGVQTMFLPSLKEQYRDAILDQCPFSLQDVCRNWQHDETWSTRVSEIDSTFGDIKLHKIETSL